MSSSQETMRGVNRYGCVVAEELNVQDDEMPQEDNLPVTSSDCVELNCIVRKNLFIIERFSIECRK